jgi:hypothetical protein
MSQRTVTFGEVEYRIERPSGRKSSRALATLRAISKAMPGLQEELAEFRRSYERENVVELDRAGARLQYPRLPYIDEDTGRPLTDEHGAIQYRPSELDAMTDEDWEKAGNVIRLPKSPSFNEEVAAMFGRALEVAEDHVYALLALFTLPNQDVKRAGRAGADELTALIDERVADLLDDGFGDEWLELGAIVGELVDEHYVQKARSMGDRMGNTLRLFGMAPPKSQISPSLSASSSDGPESSTPSSPTDSPSPTDGDPGTPSTSNGTSSSTFNSSPTTTPNANGSNAPRTPLEDPTAEEATRA